MEVRFDRSRRTYLEFASGQGTAPDTRKPSTYRDCINIVDGTIMVVRVWDSQWATLTESPCDPVAAAFTLLDSTLPITDNALKALETITMSNIKLAILKSGQVIRGSDKVIEKALDNHLLVLVPPTAEGESSLVEQIEACDARTIVTIGKAMKLDEAADIDVEAKRLRVKPEVLATLRDTIMDRVTAKSTSGRKSDDDKGDSKSPRVNTPKKAAKEGGQRTGVKPSIRAFFESGKKATLEELQEKFPGAAKSSITTAIADLRSEKYCGDGGPLKIEKDDKGTYRLAKD